MSTTEGLAQRTWPELDVSYFRWEPPAYTGAQIHGSSDSQHQTSAQRARVESVFAHSPYPTSFAGWDRIRAESEADQKAAEALAGHKRSSLANHQAEGFSDGGSEGMPEAFGSHSAGNELPLPTSELEFPQGRPLLGGQGTASAFTSLRPGDRSQQSAPSNARRSFWPPQQQAEAQRVGQASQYGGSFDGLFGAKPTSTGLGPPEDAPQERRPSSGERTSSASQSHLPTLLVQCGNFAAPVQREGQPRGRDVRSQPRSEFSPGWPTQGESRLQGRLPLGTDPLQLQEYYAAQSDALEELIRSQGLRDSSAAVSAMHGSLNPFEMDNEFLDVAGTSQLGRAASVLDVPRVGPATIHQDIEPYMPQWQSESVPAELPNHVVNRLIMRGQSHLNGSGSSRGLLGMKRDWMGLPSMQSIPDSQKTASAGRLSGVASLSSSRRKGLTASQSPNVDELEELARTADVEIAHRAFLVPPHKKRGKGGRQPAADPRLDPSIDARKANRILANRLSAARSKLKQKTQQESLDTMVKELEDHSKQLKEDAAELMEICEETEFENRRLSQQSKVLDEFSRRQHHHHVSLLKQQAEISVNFPDALHCLQDDVHLDTGPRQTGAVDELVNPQGDLYASKIYPAA